jgi:DNA-binding winged helix-turn-helix (wHTH) protein
MWERKRPKRRVGQMKFSFHDCELDLDTFELVRAGTAVQIQRLPLDVLIYLVHNRGRVVLKDELLREVWKQCVVTDGAIAQAMAVVRRAIGDRAREGFLIRTIRGRGYRFVGRVTERTSEGSGHHPVLDRRGPGTHVIHAAR